MIKIKREISDGKGFYVHNGLNSNDLEIIYKYIEEKFYERIYEVSRNNIKKFKDHGLLNYHLNSHLIDHQKIWSRESRLFDLDGINLIKKTQFFSLLKNYFQGLEITNEIHNDYPEIVWRIVRPNEKSDVGPLHTDKWFWDINKWQIPSKKKCIKVWIMIGGEENKSGLRVMPHSQKKTTWDFQVKKKSNIYKPVLDEKKQDIITDVIPTKPGKAIIFSYDLLHGGVITKGDKCRVSMEFTIFTEEWI